MNPSVLFNFTVDRGQNQIHVERSFAAPKELVWAAWTEADILDQWWAPKPYRTVTISQNFAPGGRWHYYMLSPEGEKHYCLFDYENIVPGLRFDGTDAFCDAQGNISVTKPRVHWQSRFSFENKQTVVRMTLQFKTFEDLEAIVSMGFKEGFTMGLENLDAYIAAQFMLRKQNQPGTGARTSTYVNFNGNTEEVFLFYRSVFRTEFINGIHRFGDLPAQPGQPPMSDSLKNMIIHVELPLLGGHILMGTDAPEEMGFVLKHGNNMHIQLEPDSKEEADRLFNELSAGGQIEMGMADMFWGAYFGSFTDRFGINWMINYQPK